MATCTTGLARILRASVSHRPWGREDAWIHCSCLRAACRPAPHRHRAEQGSNGSERSRAPRSLASPDRCGGGGRFPTRRSPKGMVGRWRSCSRTRARAGGSGNLGPGEGRRLVARGSTADRSGGHRPLDGGARPAPAIAGKLAGGGQPHWCCCRRVRGAVCPSNRDVPRRRCAAVALPPRPLFLHVNRRSPAACRVLGRPPLLLSLPAVVPERPEPKKGCGAACSP